MANDFFNASNAPSTGSSLSSSTQRAEFSAIEDGFDKLPTLTANGDEVVTINSGATGMTSTPAATLLSATTTAATTKATPVDADEIPLADSAAAYALKKLTWANLKATLATWLETLTATWSNKTFVAPVLGTPSSGNLANCTGYVGTSALVTTGALNSGSITSGFGSIDIGADALTAGTGTFSGDMSFGTGQATTAGLAFRRGNTTGPASGYGTIYPENLATSGNNYAFIAKYDGTNVGVNAVTGGHVYQTINGVGITDVSSTGLSLGTLALTAGSGTFSGNVVLNNTGLNGVDVTSYTGAAGYFALYSKQVTPGNSNHALISNGTTTLLSGTTSSALQASGQTIALATSTGLAVTGTVISQGASNGFVINASGGTPAGGIYLESSGTKALRFIADPDNDAGGSYIGFGVDGTALDMTLDANGNLLVGCASAPSSSVSGVITKPTGVEISGGSGTGLTYLMAFINGNGTVGNINTNGSTTTFATTSDHRLKTVLGSVTDSGTRIDALQPVEYEWKVDGSRTRGFLAHQFQAVYSGSVTGAKDAVDSEGNPVYQSMQAGSSEVIADLVAEIQSLRTRLAALEAA